MKSIPDCLRPLFVCPAILLVSCASPIALVETGAAALPSWNDGPAKRAIVEFVAAVTDEKGPDYVAPSERIAVFDNDGTFSTKPSTRLPGEAGSS